MVIVAMGMTLVIATGGIDLSGGATASFAGTLAAVVLASAWAGMAPPALAAALAIALAIAAACAFGLLNATMVARYRIQPIVATLVLFIAGRGLAEMLTDGNLRTFSGGQLDWLRARIGFLPVEGVVMAAVVLFTAWLVGATVFGRRLLATGGNERAAWLAGIPVTRVKAVAYVACAALAGLAGVMSVAMISAADPAKIGLNLELNAIAAVAVGGTSLGGGRARVGGTLIGALVIQLLEYTLLAHGIADEYALMLKAAVILLAVGLQRRGA